MGACMALGSQKWNGNWADLVKAPSSSNATITPYQGDSASVSACATISDSRNVPASMPAISRPPNSARPPPAVITSDCSAAARASLEIELKPIRRNEMKLVISQKTNMAIRLSDSTVPSIAAMNSRI